MLNKTYLLPQLLFNKINFDFSNNSQIQTFKDLTEIYIYSRKYFDF
jgi:hypothetical protein